MSSYKRAQWVVIAEAKVTHNEMITSEEELIIANEPNLIRAGIFGSLISSIEQDDFDGLTVATTSFAVDEIIKGEALTDVIVASLMYSDMLDWPISKSGWGVFPIGSHSNVSDCSVIPKFLAGQKYLLIKSHDGRVGMRDLEPLENNEVWLETIRLISTLASEFEE